MKRAYLMKYRYLTYIKGIPHFQRRFPADIVERGLAPSPNFKQSLKSSIDKPSEIIAEIDQCNERFNNYLRLLRARNLQAETKAEIDHLALTLLQTNNLSPGAIVNSANPDTAQEAIENMGIFDDLYDVSSQAQYNKQNPIYDSDILLAQKRAHEMLKEQSYTPTATLDMVRRYWIKEKKLSPDNKDHRKYLRTWDNFISINNGNALVTEEVIDEYLHHFAQVRSKEIKSSSLERQITTIISAIKLYCRHHRIKLRIEHPYVEKTKSVKRAPALLHIEQQQLVKQLNNEPDWKELYCLLGLHSGWHASEARQAQASDFIFDSEVPRFYVSSEANETRKNAERGRVIPLVFRTKRIRELIESGALDVLRSKTSDNISSQIGKLLKQINPKASMYSLRHTLAHNIEAAGERESLKANIGGWGGKEILLSEHMAKYGKDSADTIERLRPLQKALITTLNHLET